MNSNSRVESVLKPGWSRTPPLHKILFALAICLAVFIGSGIGSSFTGVIHKVLLAVR